MLFSHKVTSDSFAVPWTVAHWATLFMGFPRQEYWSGLPFTSPGDLAERGIEPTSLALADRFFTTESPGKPSDIHIFLYVPPHRALNLAGEKREGII